MLIVQKRFEAQQYLLPQLRQIPPQRILNPNRVIGEAMDLFQLQFSVVDEASDNASAGTAQINCRTFVSFIA